ncbi:MAG: hypothetical protein ACJ77K_12505 [Bacteroidia bacterium]|jgi:hypothetical protein
MESNNYANYLKDLVFLLIENLAKLHDEIKTASDPDKEYLRGQPTAYYDSLTIMRSQAGLFNIPLNDIGLADLHLEKYLQR